MTFRRELAKAILRGVISTQADKSAAGLRHSARRESPGLYREAKYALADAADSVAEDPDVVVKLIEALWDSPRRGNSN